MATLESRGGALYGLALSATRRGVLFATYMRTPEFLEDQDVVLTLEPNRTRLGLVRFARISHIEVTRAGSRERTLYGLELATAIDIRRLAAADEA